MPPVYPTANQEGGCLMPQPVWDETFMECTMDDIKDSIEEAMKSRRKVYEATTTISSPREVITVTVKKVRR